MRTFYLIGIPTLFLGIIVMGFFVMISSAGDRVPDKTVMQTTPIVVEFIPSGTFQIISPVKKVDGIDMGKVLVELKDKRLFSVIVVPMRKIPIGTTVKIFTVYYQEWSSGMQRGILVVQ